MEDITGHVTFIVIPTVSHEKSVENESFNVRTLYDYNPDADEYIPCKELGLFFKKGEILKIHRYVTWMTQVIIRVLHVKNQSHVAEQGTIFLDSLWLSESDGTIEISRFGHIDDL